MKKRGQIIPILFKCNIIQFKTTSCVKSYIVLVSDYELQEVLVVEHIRHSHEITNLGVLCDETAVQTGHRVQLGRKLVGSRHKHVHVGIRPVRFNCVLSSLWRFKTVTSQLKNNGRLDYVRWNTTERAF